MPKLASLSDPSGDYSIDDAGNVTPMNKQSLREQIASMFTDEGENFERKLDAILQAVRDSLPEKKQEIVTINTEMGQQIVNSPRPAKKVDPYTVSDIKAEGFNEAIDLIREELV